MPTIFDLTPYSVISACTAIVALLVGVLAWRRHAAPGGTSLAWLMIAVGVWATGAAFEYASLDYSHILFWAKIEYFGGVACPVFFLRYVFEYTHLKLGLSRRALAALFVVPVVTLVLVWTNEWHGLIWPSLDVSQVHPHRVIYAHGPAYWLGAIGYSYTLLLIGTALLLDAALRLPGPYRRQVRLIVAGALIPWVVNAIGILGLSPVPDLELTPLVMVVSGALLGWGISRFRLLQVVPLAHGLLIEKMVDGMIVLDAHDQIVDANPAAQAILGIGKESAIGHALQALAPELAAAVKRSRDGSARHPDVALTRDAARRFFDLRTSPLTEPDGNSLGCLVVLRDTTERHQVEDALRVSEARFHQLAEIFPETIFEADLSGRLTYVNAHGLRQFGISEQDLAQGICMFDLMLAEDRAAGMQRIQDRLAGRRGDYFEYRAVRRDQSVFDALAYSAPILREGQPAGIRGFVMDISNRKRTEDALRESEAELRTLVDYSPAAIIKFSPDGDILYWNAMAEKMYGRTAAEVLGKPLPTVPLSKLHERLDFQSQVNQGEVIPYAEVTRVRKDGSPIDIGLSVAPLQNPAGQVYAQMSISIDISALKHAQAELARRAQTVALLEERARLGRDLHDSVTQLLYSVMLFADASKDAAQSDNVALALQCLTRLSETARQALKELRLRVFELRPSVLESEGLASALHQRLELVEQRAGVRSDLNITLASPLPAPVELAVYWITQEALNNTLKHANATHVRLDLTADASGLKLVIADDGKGFEMDALREHAGLGVTSMKERVRDLGGMFEIESAPCQGTRILVTLPGYVLAVAGCDPSGGENRTS